MLVRVPSFPAGDVTQLRSWVHDVARRVRLGSAIIAAVGGFVWVTDRDEGLLFKVQPS
jgi:hypothetical protein